MYFHHVSRGIQGLLFSGSFLMLLINIDRLGNALAGGSHLNTVSGRVGARVLVSDNPFWHFMRRVIDATFKPIDGKDHCHKAFIWESSRIESYANHRRGNDVGLVVLCLLTVVACLVLFPIIRVIGLFKKPEKS